MLTSAESDVLEAIDARRDEAVALFREMIRTKSVNPRLDPSSPGEGEMARLVQREYSQLGIPYESIEFEPGRPNTVAYLEGVDGGPTLMVNCHVDTVTPNEAESWYDPLRKVWIDRWSVDPFGAELREGAIWGRGTADHKMPVAATVTALKGLRDAGVQLRGNLLLVHDVDEETGGEAGMRALAKARRLRADAALYACTTSFTEEAVGFFPSLGLENVIRALQGTQRYRITVSGQTYHTLTPKVGRNAVENALEVMAALERLMATVNARVDELTGSGQPLMRIVRVGSEAPAASRPASRVYIEAVRRLPPGVDREKAFAEVRQAVTTCARPADGFTVDCAKVSEVPASEVPADHPLVLALAGAARDVRGRPPRVTGIPASVGISQFLATNPIPTVMFGYGILNFHHAYDERVAVADFIDTAKAYALGFMRYLGVA